MRELKFRAWHKENKQMHEASSIKFDEKEVGYIYEMQIPEHNVEADEAFFDFDEVELMQSTGLKDKNGVEIFEGDIVKFVNKKGVEIISEVVFYDGIFELTNYDYKDCTDSSCINCYELLKWVACGCEVVGNIHQNKEFLNGKKKHTDRKSRTFKAC